MNVKNILGKARGCKHPLHIVNTIKGANYKMQHEWHNMTASQQHINLKKFKDSDNDGVPDKWDCQPKNPFKQGQDEFGIFCDNCGTRRANFYGTQHGLLCTYCARAFGYYV